MIMPSAPRGGPTANPSGLRRPRQAVVGRADRWQRRDCTMFGQVPGIGSGGRVPDAQRPAQPGDRRQGYSTQAIRAELRRRHPATIPTARPASQPTSARQVRRPPAFDPRLQAPQHRRTLLQPTCRPRDRHQIRQNRHARHDRPGTLLICPRTRPSGNHSEPESGSAPGRHTLPSTTVQLRRPVLGYGAPAHTPSLPSPTGSSPTSPHPPDRRRRKDTPKVWSSCSNTNGKRAPSSARTTRTSLPLTRVRIVNDTSSACPRPLPIRCPTLAVLGSRDALTAYRTWWRAASEVC